VRPSQLRPNGVRTQVDARCTRAVDSSAFQEVQEVLLARLPEGEPVEGEVILEGHDFGGIPAERIVDDLTLDPERAGIDPVGRELAELAIRAAVCLPLASLLYRRRTTT
jgi:hypothetical protein